VAAFRWKIPTGRGHISIPKLARSARAMCCSLDGPRLPHLPQIAKRMYQIAAPRRRDFSTRYAANGRHKIPAILSTDHSDDTHCYSFASLRENLSSPLGPARGIFVGKERDSRKMQSAKILSVLLVERQ